MLNINTQMCQSILIGEDFTLTLNRFDEDHIDVSIKSYGDQHVYTIYAGNYKKVAPDTILHYNGIGDNGILYAVLGFTAPKYIKIIGEWKTGNRDGGPMTREKLSKMSNANLLFYANMNAKSALEHELFQRFKRTLRQ